MIPGWSSLTFEPLRLASSKASFLLSFSVGLASPVTGVGSDSVPVPASFVPGASRLTRRLLVGGTLYPASLLVSPFFVEVAFSVLGLIIASFLSCIGLSTVAAG